MRVLLDVSAVPARPVGAGVYTIAMAGGLAHRGEIELHLLTRRDDTARWHALAPGAEVHALAPNRRPARLAWEQLSGPAVAHEIRPDVWHAPHYTMPLRSRVATVVAMHDLTFFDHPEWHERSKVVYFRRMMRAAARRADVILTGSHDAADAIRARFSVKGEIIVVHHGVDHDRFAPAGDPSTDEARDWEALVRHGVARPYVAFASTIEPRKDVPTLVRAFARVARTHPDLQLVLAGGDGWGLAQARAAITASGVATRVLRPGYVDDATLAALFRRADVIAYPSLAEGFGMPALEALASGTPLVTTSGSAVEEVVGDAALLVPTADPDALARALGTVLDDPEVAARLRRAGPPRAAEFTWERSVDAHIDAYGRAVRRQRERPGHRVRTGRHRNGPHRMRALVTGATGFVGPHLLAHLLESGDDVIVAGDAAGGFDLTDRDVVHRVLAEQRPEVVYHLAAFSDVGASWRDPTVCLRVNVEGTANVLDAARACGARRVLVVGSSEEYGKIDAGGPPLREDAPLRPITPYGASKVAASFLALQSWLGAGLETVRVRAFSHTGPGQSDRFVVPALAHRIVAAGREGKSSIPIGAREPVRDLSDVRDVVRAYRLLLQHGEPGGVYNVCSGTGISIGEIADELVVRAGGGIEAVVDPALVRPVEVPRLVGDPARLVAATGWSPKYTIGETLDAVLADAHAHGS